MSLTVLVLARASVIYSHKSYYPLILNKLLNFEQGCVTALLLCVCVCTCGDVYLHF